MQSSHNSLHQTMLSNTAMMSVLHLKMDSCREQCRTSGQTSNSGWKISRKMQLFSCTVSFKLHRILSQLLYVKRLRSILYRNQTKILGSVTSEKDWYEL